ncbi:uncharacterized protein HaLaN_00070, partial [Haematococcus lacustris]
MEAGTCRYGHKCQFAHGAEELRPVPRHPKYKTEVGADLEPRPCLAELPLPWAVC